MSKERNIIIEYKTDIYIYIYIYMRKNEITEYKTNIELRM